MKYQKNSFFIFQVGGQVIRNLVLLLRGILVNTWIEYRGRSFHVTELVENTLAQRLFRKLLEI